MPYGGNDWLALTQEPTLEPEIPISDPHHHFWDLRPERTPYQRYLLHELLADVNCGHNVRSTVFIETRAMYRPAGPAEMRSVGEVGLIPNLFPEGQNQGLYHTADATLWFFHALHRYIEHCQDKATLELLLPILKDIVGHHLKGTRFGIKVDPRDGLLTQGEGGYALTWMDAKVGDWVVTPRRGKAVEINALWYNALCLLADWLREAKDPEADELGAYANKTRDSFNRRFWHAAGGYLYDVVDGENGDDAAFRPNQILAIALEHPVLDREYWEAVVTAVHTKLVTPVGLRSLAPDEPDYKARYFGDLRARDAAYHRGTVWAWLIGPFIDAWLKVYPDDRGTARHFLDGFEPHLAEAGIGSISEVFDAEPPFTPRGCIAQAWSVAEVLRCLAKTAVEQI